MVIIQLIDQLTAFLVTLMIGVLAGLLFDFYRVIAKLIKLNKWGTVVGDFIFWLVLTPIAFLFLLWGNWGEFRFYVVIGLLLGAAIYLRCLSPYAVSLFNYLLLVIHKFFSWLWRILALLLAALCWPFRLLFTAVTVPLKVMGKMLSWLVQPMKKLAKPITVKISKLFSRKKG